MLLVVVVVVFIGLPPPSSSEAAPLEVLSLDLFFFGLRVPSSFLLFLDDALLLFFVAVVISALSSLALPSSAVIASTCSVGLCIAPSSSWTCSSPPPKAPLPGREPDDEPPPPPVSLDESEGGRQLRYKIDSSSDAADPLASPPYATDDTGDADTNPPHLCEASAL
jgi:hypothetical protein